MNSEQQDFLQSIIDDSSLGVLAVSADEAAESADEFSCVLANSQFVSWAGINKSMLPGTLLSDVFSGKSAYKLIQRIQNSLQEEEKLTFDQWVKFAGKGSGDWFNVTVASKSDLILLEFQEINQLKDAEVEAEWNELKYKKLFDESLDAILVTNQHFDCINANQAFLKLFDFDLPSLTAANLQSLFISTSDYDHFLQQMKEDYSVEHELVLVDQSGARKTCVMNASQMTDDTDHFLYLFVIRDITKRKQAENQLLRVEKLALTGKISRMIAHEVRNPLTNLNLALEQLRDELKDQVEDAEMYFDIIQRNADRINTLISDLLNSSKPKQLNLEPHAMAAILDETIEMIKDRIALKGMKVSRKYTDNQLLASVDREQLRTAILNLLVNAVEAMKPGEGHLQISLQQQEEYLYLEIKDNGRGISEDHLNQLFEPFFTGKKTGTGLGLTAVQNIINGHDGHIDVESKLGVGTTFTVTLPLVV